MNATEMTPDITPNVDAVERSICRHCDARILRRTDRISRPWQHDRGPDRAARRGCSDAFDAPDAAPIDLAVEVVSEATTSPGPHGIWSEAAGGVIATEHTYALATVELERLVAEDGEDADDLSVIELCGDHEEQPADGCEDCAEEAAAEHEEERLAGIAEPEAVCALLVHGNPVAYYADLRDADDAGRAGAGDGRWTRTAWRTADLCDICRAATSPEGTCETCSA